MLARASNDFSALTRKHSFRSSSCVTVCRHCASANRRSVLSCRRSLTRPNDRATFLRLAETLTAFLARLRGAADTLSITERQRIVRLVVKDIQIGDDTITIRHSIAVPQGPPQGGCLPPNQTGTPNYLLCKGSGADNPGCRPPFRRPTPLDGRRLLPNRYLSTSHPAARRPMPERTAQLIEIQIHHRRRVKR
jgi:hypothetical protein